MSEQKPKILLAEDEESLGMIIQESLSTRGFDVTLHKDGEEARKAFLQEVPDLMVLDVMMPKLDGFSFVQEVRKQNQFVPIIFLTAKSRTEDVVEGFGYGANDYLKKPFSMEELIVRIKALLNRNEAVKKTKGPVPIGAYMFDRSAQTLSHAKLTEPHQLTHRESELLSALIGNKNQLTDRKMILESLWGNDDFFNARSMDVFISKLRKKLALDESIQILNVHGKGFKMIAPD